MSRKRKLNFDNEEDVNRLLNLLDEVDLEDEFVGDIESGASVSSESTTESEDEEMDLTEDNHIEHDDTIEQDGFVWREQSYIDRKALEFTGDPGVKVNLVNIVSPCEIFEAFVCDEVINLMVTETNKFSEKYGSEKREPGKMKLKSGDLLWKDTTADEMRVVIAFVILQGVIKKPNIDDYHSTKRLLETPIFNKVISRDRFKLILKYLHFTEPERTSDPLYKIRDVLNILLPKFQANYVPSKYINIDESLLLWKGRMMWKRYNPMTRKRLDIESHILAESSTGYVWNMLIYCGKQTQYPLGLCHSILTKPSHIVLSLIEPLLNQGYCVGMDDYYSSPELFRILLDHKTDAVGTVQCNRKNLSQMVNNKQLKKGKAVCQFSGKIMHLKWKDEKEVNMLSTLYQPTMEAVTVAEQRMLKPTVCVNFTRHHMTGVDLMNQINSCASFIRKKTKKDYRKIFFRLIEICIKNSHCIYKHNGGSKTMKAFKVQLVEEILERHCKDVYWGKKPGRIGLENYPLRLTGRHFPVVTSSEHREASSKHIQRRCKYCSLQKKVKRTIYSCDICGVSLCVAPCFKLYHTEEYLPDEK